MQGDRRTQFVYLNGLARSKRFEQNDVYTDAHSDITFHTIQVKLWTIEPTCGHVAFLQLSLLEHM